MGTDLREPFLRFPDGDLRNPDSYPRSWTVLQRRRMALDVHPATANRFAENGETCRSCTYCHGTSHQSSRVFYKCDLIAPTHGPGTDIRVGWPACTQWEERDD